MADRRQLRLLLWKDYLIRKRKLITLAGIIWATAVMFSLYVVRSNVDNQDFPTCGFPARALPSAGMIPFLQSLMCTVNNECSPLDQFDELPTYENSKITQLQRKLAPIINDTVLDVAETVPDAIKLLATLADVVDEPTLIDISKNGLKVKDLFTNPVRVKRFLSSKLKLNGSEARSLMDAELSFQGLIKGDINRCSVTSVNETLLIDPEYLVSIAEKLCEITTEEFQKIFMDLLFEVDYAKFMNMLGDMFYKLSGDRRISTIGDLMTAVLRMMRLQSFLPPEMLSIFQDQTVDFSYFKLDLISKLMDLFKPTFGDTESYQKIRDFAETVIVGLQYMDKVFAKHRTNNENNTTDDISENVGENHGIEAGLQAMSNIFHNAGDVLQDAMSKDSSIDTFSILSQIMNFVNKFLPEKTKHDVLFYSTLLAKLMESAHKVVDINMHIEQLTYNITLRNPAAVEILQKIPPHIVGKAFDALTDAERTQILTSKINFPGQMFCDVYKLQTFFVISKSEAEALKKQLCVDTWKNYVSDLIKSFGVFDVKNNINNMASLLIQETLGKDTTDQLYSLDQDFKVLKNFTTALMRIEQEPAQPVDWTKLFQAKDNDELLKVVRAKAELGKQMLIVVHGALAKEIVKQNPILDFKLSPYLNDVIILVSAINKQLELSPNPLAQNMKTLYPKIVETMLNTALNEEKTYKSLSTPGTSIFCNGVAAASEFIELPSDQDTELLVDTLCKSTMAIEIGMQNDSAVSKAINTIRNSEHPIVQLNWNALIMHLKELYLKLDRDYTYLFKFTHYGMTDEDKTRLNAIFVKAKDYWFGVNNIERSMHLSIKLGLRLLDLLDYGLFDVTGNIWLKIKFAITTAAGPYDVFHETLQLVTGLLMNSTFEYSGDLPPTTVQAISDIVPNIPQLIADAVDIIVRGDTDIQPIISILNAYPPWPCSSTSMSELLQITSQSKIAVQGIETILCMNRQFLDEWTGYLQDKNATVKKSNTWNTTEYEPHLLLKFSSIVDAMIEDIKSTKKALDYTFEDSTDGRFGMKEALNYALKSLNISERDAVLRTMFTQIDTALNAINTTSIPDDVPLSNLWERFTNCTISDDDCKMVGRKAWKYFFESFSVILENIATDLLTYFKEINEPNSNLLQLLGFTRNTGLYMLYDNTPEFMGVLLNSYWDFGFMSQVRRATLFEFWDCDEVVSALVPPPGSTIDKKMIKKVQPFICPSLLHWLSLPRGDNTLLDVFSKPQYYVYTLQVKNLTSRYEKAYTKATELADYLMDVSKKNQTIITDDDPTLNTIEDKLKQTVDKIFNFKIEEDNAKYRQFSEINSKQFAAYIYLTRIVVIVNKLQENIDNIEISTITDDENMKAVDSDLTIIKYLFKRKPADAIAMHFDLITNVIWNEKENYNLVDAFSSICDDLKNNISRKILDTKTINQLCTKRYREIYGAVQNSVVSEFVEAKKSLLNLINVLQNGENAEVTDIAEFLSGRKTLISSLKNSIKYSYDLSIPIYLKYLQSNLRSYNVILSFLAGEDWWKELKQVYSGPYASQFFGQVENSFDLAEDWFSKFDEFHIVRLLHDVDTNSTESFCQNNVTLSDYLPDSTGLLSTLKRQLCDAEHTELFREIPPLLYASQGYESSLKLSKEVDYTALNMDLNTIESHLTLIANGPKSPLPPPWVTEERLQHLRTVALKLMAKETLTRAAFGTMSNLVDAGTLFLNNSQCTACSQFTTWFKQLNLQLYKKQEYDSLLCHLNAMSLDDVYLTLKNDFHWDMSIRELISYRNYTKYEMNKSMNEFLSQVKVHLLEDMAANTTKLTQCLIKNVTRNELGNATLFASVLSHTATLIRAALPHIHEVTGVKDIPYLKELSTQVTHNLDVVRPVSELLNTKSDIHHELHKCIEGHDVVFYIQDGAINLRKMQNSAVINEYLEPTSSNWSYICSNYDCRCINEVVISNVNATLVKSLLPKLQLEEFWRFTFVSNILAHVQGVVSHGARILGVASLVDIHGLMDGKIAAMVDTLMLFINEDILGSVLFSLQGITEQLQPLLQSTPLEHDLKALSAGLNVLRELKNYLLDEVNLKLEVAQLFPDGDKIEVGLSALGINNTNFWSIAAPRIRAGHMQLKPLLTCKPEDCHISNYVCQLDPMSKVIIPSSLDVVTAEDVLSFVADQFCGLEDKRGQQVVSVLMRGFNFSVVLDQVKSVLLTKLYAASNLTTSEGATVLSKFSQMAALVPLVQQNVGDVGDLLGNEPIFQSLKDFSNVGGLMSSPEFLSSAGSLMCGKPFEISSNRFYKAIAATPDLSTAPDQAQLDVLPTDFCRSLYQDIIKMEGGKLVWSFVKPLIMGKILYTPPSPTVVRIIEKANTTFATIIKLSNLIHSFAGSFPAVHKLTSHRDGVGVLKRLLTQPQFEEIREMLVGGGGVRDMGDVDVDGVLDEFGDVESIGSLLTKASDLLHCINLNRFQPSPDEEHLTHEAAKLSIVNEFSAGVVFLNAEDQDDSLSNVEYKIRMDIDNAPTTKRLKDYLWIPGPESSFIENMRYFRGFVQIQDLVDNAIIQLSRSSRHKRDTSEKEMEYAVYTQQTPYPCYRKDYFQTSLYDSQSLIVAFFFSLLFTVASAVRFIVSDKETGNTMLMSVMGVNLRWHTLSWLLSSLAEMVVTCVCITLVLFYGGILPTTSPTLVFTLLVIFGVAVLSFCYMLSKLFMSASLAAVCAAIAYLMSFMPFVIILSLEAVLYSELKLLVCLSMSSSVCYAFLYISRFEAGGAGAGWRDVWRAPDEDRDMSIGVAAAMMLLDAFLYAAIGYAIDWYFGVKAVTTNITHYTTTDEKAGVSIVNVSKVFHSGTRQEHAALKNVSVELSRGQITTLLGHNGAGKTTLINILTGMLKPTDGQVSIRSDRRTRLGVCPQKDVLFQYMTAEEHIMLYAQLKSGLSTQEVRGEVDRMLGVLSLGQYASVPAARLSGGTRRRLCVALAFVGAPHLVVLDEPTAGVDPAARRDIWSMIVKLKEDRTILLTTHHLDEAELLSDQIVIMHKGQIHTTGSPIEIKRTLGNGYQLTVTYRERSPDLDSPWEETSQEEKTKQLLTLVRDTVKNANLTDVSGLEVEIGLPFFDANGVNNNYLQLCSSLETTQSALGFKSYSMDCSSLEQVFFNVCQQADTPLQGLEYVSEGSPSKSASSSSIRTDRGTQSLLPPDGPVKGSTWQQFLALMHARFLHHMRNKWLVFMLVCLPTLFVVSAMAFSMLRPPADNEVPLRLDQLLYENSTQFIVPGPSIYSNSVDPEFAESVLQQLMTDWHSRNWTAQDSPTCKCTETRQECDITQNQTLDLPEMMVLPDVETLNNWLVDTQQIYIEKRYGGYTSVLKNNLTYLIAWYNNKGHHALPSYISAIHSAVLRSVSASPHANITVYTHPLKISKEQISKATVYQHIADAGISGLVLVAYCLISAGAAIYLVAARRSQEKRLQLLCGVSPAMYWAAALLWDMMVIFINMCITAGVMSAFGFPVFVDRNNLPAICILILLYGFACGNLVHVCEKLFSEPSMANMVLFCGNAFLGLSLIAILLIMDIISESETTDHARVVLHKIFLLAPQFALGDGMLEIAKNTIQAQVLSRFGMDTYKDPLRSSLVVYHYVYLAVVGLVLMVVNLAIEYDCFEILMKRFRSEEIPSLSSCELEARDVRDERARVRRARDAGAHAPLRVNTLGNINRGFVHSECKTGSGRAVPWSEGDVAQCVSLGKRYGSRIAVRDLTFGIPPGQCTALLGQNGAGKSSTFSMLTGELRPTTGDIYLNNKLVNATQLCNGLISYCPQSDAIDPLLTVRETLQFYCKLRGIEDQDETIHRTISMFDLYKYCNVPSGVLSGGNKRKLCTAIAFMARTPLVLLDEPTSGMDPVSRACVWRGVASARAARRGVLLSTHALHDARRLAARVALLRAGGLVALADVDECATRFGGGYVVQARARSGPRAAWERVRARAPHARLRVLHVHTLQFLLPMKATVDKKEITTRLSDIFRLMAELQSSCDIEDYTINQSSLEEMFLSFTDKADDDNEPVEIEPLSKTNLFTPQKVDELDTVTAL